MALDNEVATVTGIDHLTVCVPLAVVVAISSAAFTGTASSPFPFLVSALPLLPPLLPIFTFPLDGTVLPIPSGSCESAPYF